jgi:hypothetical protein
VVPEAGAEKKLHKSLASTYAADRRGKKEPQVRAVLPLRALPRSPAPAPGGGSARRASTAPAAAAASAALAPAACSAPVHAGPCLAGLQVRYRDGQVVSKRGEKFVLETVGEDWDGGSKGKVYTKGKRGKGFV